MVLGIYGYGGLGREVYVIANKINTMGKRWDEIIFIDDAVDSINASGVSAYSFSRARENFPELEIVIGVGEPAVRAILFDKVKNENIKIATLIHPGVYIDSTTSIGEGTVICEGVTITCDVKIGCDTYIQPHAVIGHDISVGSHSVIGANCQIGGRNRIGERTYMGFLSGTKEGLTIGSDVICSAGAIVFQDLPDAVIVVGNPARIMKRNENKRVFLH